MESRFIKLRFIKLRFMKLRFIKLRFIKLRFIKLRSHVYKKRLRVLFMSYIKYFVLMVKFSRPKHLALKDIYVVVLIVYIIIIR
jgi:hypothetical protein